MDFEARLSRLEQSNRRLKHIICLLVAAREYKRSSAITTRFRTHNQALGHFW
jgi:hypothetical protein